MFEKLKNLIDFFATPVIMFVAIGVVDGIWRMSESWISFAVCLMLFVVMVLSVIANFRWYGNIMKCGCIVLCAITALSMYTEAPSGKKPESFDNPSYYNSNSRNSYNYGYVYDDDDHYDRNDSFTVDCFRCNGSGKCEDCGGSGRSKLTGVLAAGGCALCDASGRCYKCNGKGYTVHY